MIIVDRIKELYLRHRHAKRDPTIRFMFPVAIGVAVFLGASAITSSNVSYIRIEPSQSVVKNGDRFSLAIFASAHVPVNAVDISLTFSPSAVEVLSVDTGQSVITLWTEQPKVMGNTVTMRGGTYRRGFTGEHKVATINLVAKATGQAEFTVDTAELLAGDGRGTVVPVDKSADRKLSLYIYDQNEDPANIGANITIHIITDIDGDGRVTLSDISAFMAAWATKSAVYDFNSDGRMTFRDFSIILADYFTRK